MEAPDSLDVLDAVNRKAAIFFLRVTVKKDT
jgi:hypothetical protein